MKKTRFIVCILALVLIASIFASCSAHSKDNAVNDGYYGGDANNSPSMGAPMDKEEIYDTVFPESPDNVSSPDTTKIIKTMTIEAQTKEYDKAINDIKAILSANGGYVENSSVSGNDYRRNGARYASFTFRIPADKLDAFRASIEEALNVTKLSENVQNVGQQYVDIEARLETLKSERDGLRKIIQSLNTSSQYDYWYKMTQRLSELEQQIAIYEAQLRSLDSKIAYSTCNLYLSEVVEYTVPTVKPKTFGERFGAAFKDSWEDFGNGCQNFAIWFVGAIPTLLVLAVVFGGIGIIATKVLKKFSGSKRNGN
jgi:hypothetical protein